MGMTASGSVASISVRRTIGRLTNWLERVPSSKYSSKAARSASLDRSSCRSSTISASGISCRTQISAPNPIASNATDSERPRARLERKTLSTEWTPRPT